jgi:hypothetical protein
MEPKLQDSAPRWKISVLYAQESEAGEMEFTLKCKDIPIGSTLTMSADTRGPVPPIYLPPTVVSTYPAFNTGIVAEVPANYRSKISFELFSIDKPPAGSRVTFQAAYRIPPDGDLTLASDPVRIIVVSEVTITN